MEKRYQIFISSTFADLEEERKAIMEAIIDLNCFPAGMEMFPADDSEQFEFIKTIIDESDYYVLVIAGRYGSTADDGISYTEKEYEYALEKGIPVLVFYRRNIGSITIDKTDNDQEKSRKLQAFREKAMENKLAKSWETPDELKYVVGNSLSRIFKTKPRIGWIKGNSVSDVSTYKKLEDLRHELDGLRLENKKLKEKIVDANNEKIEDLSQGEDKIRINYSFAIGFDTIRQNVELTWNKLFSLIGANFIAAQNIDKSKEIVDNAIKSYLSNDKPHFHVNNDDFNLMKIQFDALGMLRCFDSKSLKGGVIEFIQLTDKGKHELIKIKAIKRNKE